MGDLSSNKKKRLSRAFAIMMCIALVISTVFGGIQGKVYADADENEIDHIELVLIGNEDSISVIEENPEFGEYNEGYFHYDVGRIISNFVTGVVVYYKSEAVETYMYRYNEEMDNYWYYTDDGKDIAMTGHRDNQSIDNVWSADNNGNNIFTFEIYNNAGDDADVIGSIDVSVTILKANLGISQAVFSYPEGREISIGQSQARIDAETGMRIYDWKNEYFLGGTLTITYENGNTEVLTYGEWQPEGESSPYYGFINESGVDPFYDSSSGMTDVFFYNNQQEEWQPGQHAFLVLGLGNNIVEAPVTIIQEDIVTVTGIDFSFDNAGGGNVLENTCGHEDYEGYYRYEWERILKDGKLIVSLSDNTEKIYKCDSWYFYDADTHQGMPYDFDVASNQPNDMYGRGVDEYKWTVGKEDCEFVISVAGKKAYVPINIIENPVSSIEYNWPEGFSGIEENDTRYGYFNEDYDFFCYGIGNVIEQPGSKIIVTKKDNTTEEYTCQEVRTDIGDGQFSVTYRYCDGENNEMPYEYDYNSNMWENKGWRKGSDNNIITLTVSGVSCTVNVNIIDSSSTGGDVQVDEEWYKDYEYVIDNGEIILNRYVWSSVKI